MMKRIKTLPFALTDRFIIHHISFIITILGFLYVLVMPPFQSPDEPNHFFRAWQVSEGHFFPEKTGNRLGGMLPASVSQVCDSFLVLKNNQSARLKLRTLYNTLAIPLQPENRRFTDFANTAIYAPTAYLPQAAAIVLLRPFGATPLQLLYAARFANLLFWIALVFAALRQIPFLHSTLAAMALLPSSLCIAASANADVGTNGLCWWLIAVLLTRPVATAFGKQILVVALVAANKIITVPLLLLGLVPRITQQHDQRKEPHTGRLRQLAILCFTGVLVAALWGRYAQEQFIPYDGYASEFRDSQTLNAGVDPARQMAFVFENPVFFVKTCTKSLIRAIPSMAAHVVGKFGWEKNYLPTGWLLVLWLSLGGLILSEKNPFSMRQRLALGAVTFLYVCAFALTMYTLWSPVGADKMDNWQGRYFVPILPVAAMAIMQGWLEQWKQQIKVAAFAALILGNMTMLLCVLERYWQ